MTHNHHNHRFYLNINLIKGFKLKKRYDIELCKVAEFFYQKKLQVTSFNMMSQAIPGLEHFSTDRANDPTSVHMVGLDVGAEVVLLFRGLPAHFTDPAQCIPIHSGLKLQVQI